MLCSKLRYQKVSDCKSFHIKTRALQQCDTWARNLAPFHAQGRLAPRARNLFGQTSALEQCDTRNINAEHLDVRGEAKLLNPTEARVEG